MKQLFSIILAASLLMCLAACTMPAETPENEIECAISMQEDVVKNNTDFAVSGTGLTAEELKNAKLGEQFTYYGFDREGNVISSNGRIAPYWYNGRIVATFSAAYDLETGQVLSSTFGKSHVKELNEVLSSTELDLSRGIVIGGGQNREFATDGIHILMWPAVGNPDMFIDEPLSDEEMQALCGTMWENATDRFYGIDPDK